MPTKKECHLALNPPLVEPWTTESYFTNEGGLITRELFRTTIRLKRGSLGPFIEHFRQVAAAGEPFFLQFYSPAGYLIEAEVRQIELPDEQGTTYDIVHPLIALSAEDQALVFPTGEIEMMGY